MQDIITRANDILAPYLEDKSGGGGPEPSFVLHLTNDVHQGSNLYAVQKSFLGEFQFDVFFESASGAHSLDCEFYSRPLRQRVAESGA
jgi:mannosyl-oligosaccharide glucosidase